MHEVVAKLGSRLTPYRAHVARVDGRVMPAGSRPWPSTVMSTNHHVPRKQADALPTVTGTADGTCAKGITRRVCSQERVSSPRYQVAAGIRATLSRFPEPTTLEPTFR